MSHLAQCPGIPGYVMENDINIFWLDPINTGFGTCFSHSEKIFGIRAFSDGREVNITRNELHSQRKGT